LGARPQFVKASVVSRAIQIHNDSSTAPEQHIQEILVHTGQHYDVNMSDVFFKELSIPQPGYHLAVGSGLHGLQTGKMLMRIEEILVKERPDIVLVYGDTNSTLAGALAASKLHIPVAHVEAGLRSFNREMPEEINRVLTDHISGLLFCPTRTAVENLMQEGIDQNVYNVGDVMYDCHLHSLEVAERESLILRDLGLSEGTSVSDYYLATVHRPANTDVPERLRDIFGALSELEAPVILPLHPRTKKVCENTDIEPGQNVRIIEPVSYLDMCLLQKSAIAILTDSGGVQKEAYFCRVPCVTLRDETEWVETVENGWNVVVGANKARILSAVETFRTEGLPETTGNLYGDGKAAERIVAMMSSSSGILQ